MTIRLISGSLRKTAFLLVICFITQFELSIVPHAYAEQNRAGIQIPNLKQAPMKGMTDFNTGPCTGEILNAHFYPGLLEYLDGNYAYSAAQMDYFIDRPQYTHMNQRQSEYFSIAHYIRGSILLDHAAGAGRYQLAISDFEASIQWNKQNFESYLKLAAAYRETQMIDRAISTLKTLLSLQPPGQVGKDATRMLDGILHKK